MATLLAALTLAGCAGPRAADAPELGTPLEGPAHAFRLTDQFGEEVALADFLGRVVVLAFLDPQCTDVCPMTALHLQQLDAALQKAGALQEAGARVVYLGVNANAAYNSVEDVYEATRRWPVNGLENWHFLTGSADALQPVWEAYGVFVREQSEQARVLHTLAIYLIDAAGRLRWLIRPPGQPDEWTDFDLSGWLEAHVGELLAEG